MRQQSIPVGKILGIPIGLDWSWFLIVGLLSYSLASGYYPARYDWSGSLFWLAGGATALLLFGSVLLHELGHAIAARIFHVPVRRIRLMIFGGVAEMGDEPPSATAEFVIAIAGPLVSVAVAGFAFVGASMLRLSGAIDLLALEVVAGVTAYLALVNIMLTLFNLIPGFPLDGGRVLRAILWGIRGNLRSATLIAAQVGRVIAYGFIILGAAQVVMGIVGNGLWTGFIGFFLLQAAKAEVRTQNLRDLLNSRQVHQIMRPLYSPSYYEASEQHVAPDARVWSALMKMEQENVTRLTVSLEGRTLGVLLKEDIFALLRSLQFQSPIMIGRQV